LYLLTIIEAREGVGQNREQFTIKISISLGLMPVDANN